MKKYILAFLLLVSLPLFGQIKYPYGQIDSLRTTLVKWDSTGPAPIPPLHKAYVWGQGEGKLYIRYPSGAIHNLDSAGISSIDSALIVTVSRLRDSLIFAVHRGDSTYLYVTPKHLNDSALTFLHLGDSTWKYSSFYQGTLKALKTTSVATGFGLSGGGDFSANRTHIVDTNYIPSKYSLDTAKAAIRAQILPVDSADFQKYGDTLTWDATKSNLLAYPLTVTLRQGAYLSDTTKFPLTSSLRQGAYLSDTTKDLAKSDSADGTAGGAKYTSATRLNALLATKQNSLTGAIGGTSNQVTVSSNTNSVASNITLSLPQNIDTSATPQFSGLGLGMALGANHMLEFANPSNTTGDGILIYNNGSNSRLVTGTMSYIHLSGENTDPTPTHSFNPLIQLKTIADTTDNAAGADVQNWGNGDGIHIDNRGKAGGFTTNPTGLGIDMNRNVSSEYSTTNNNWGVRVFDWSNTSNSNGAMIDLEEKVNNNHNRPGIYIQKNQAAMHIYAPGGSGFDGTKDMILVDSSGHALFELLASGKIIMENKITNLTQGTASGDAVAVPGSSAITTVGTLTSGAIGLGFTIIDTTYLGGVSNIVVGAGLSVSAGGKTRALTNTGVTSIAGTSNQVIASASTGGVTLSTPQNIDTSAGMQLGSAKIEAATTSPSFDITNTTTNILRNTAAQRRDTSNYNISFTASGKAQISITDTAGTQVVFIDSTGRLTLSQSVNTASNTLTLNAVGTASQNTVFGSMSGGTRAIPTAVISGNGLMSIKAGGYNGSAFTGTKALVTLNGAGTWTTSSNPTLISFQTTKAGGTTLSEKMRLNDSGYVEMTNGFLKINNVTTEGPGVAAITDSVARSGQTATIAATTLNSTATNGLYRISLYIYPTTAGTSGTVTGTIRWNDGAAESATSSAHTFGALGTPVVLEGKICRVTNSTAITYETTVTAAVGSPVYEIDVIAEKLH